jgi:hypothetical protein
MGYITLQSGDAFTDPSYTVRSCFPDTVFRKVLSNDIAYHGQNYGIGTSSIGGTALIASVVREGWIGAPGVTQTFLSGDSNPSIDRQDPSGTAYPLAYKQSTLDDYSQYGLGRLEDAGRPISSNADGFYNNGLQVLVVANEEKPYNLQSSFDDDFTTGFLSNQDETFYIQMPIWNWPGGELASGTVTFSSSITYNPDDTVSIPFDSEYVGEGLGFIGDLSTSGDKIWRINRDILEGSQPSLGGTVDLSNVKRVRITLNSGTADYTFKTGPMKIIGDSYNYYKSNVDTKRGHLIMERWPSISQEDLPPLVQDGITVKNFNYIAKFSVGDTLPDPQVIFTEQEGIIPQDESLILGAEGTHELGLFVRVHPDRKTNPLLYVSVKVFMDSEKTEIALYEGAEKKVFFYKNGPIPSGEYFLIVQCQDEKINASLWNGEGNFVGNILLETGFQKISDNWLNGTGLDVGGYEAGYGYAGYEFRPRSGDFYLDYVYSKDVALAEYESKTFESNLPLEGATLFVNSIQDQELFENGIDGLVKLRTADNFFLGNNEVGDLDTDVIISKDTNTKYNTESLRVKKTSSSEIATVVYDPYVTVPNFSRLILKMKLLYDESLQNGKFKVVFWDRKRQQIAYLQELTSIIPSKWNEIEIPLISNTIYNDELLFEFGFFGDQPGNYWIEDISLTTEAVEWEASNDGGETYLPFLTAINGEYNSINFPSNNFYSLVIRDSPKTFYDFGYLNDVKSYPQNGTASITNRYPLNVNSGSVVTSAGSTTFAYPVLVPSISDTYSGETYSLPKSVQTQNKDFCVGLYKDSQVIIPEFSPTFAGTALTYSVWFYTNDDLYDRPLGMSGEIVSPNWSIDLISQSNSISGNPSIKFTSTSSVEFSVSSSWNDESWHQVTFTYDNEYIRIYYDGELIGAENKENIGDLPAIVDEPIRILGPAEGTIPQQFIRFNDDDRQTIDISQPITFVNTVILYDQVLTEEKIKNQYVTSIAEYNQLRIRARAYARNAWIAGYEVIPKYAKLGRIVAQESDVFRMRFDEARFGLTKFD